MNYQSIIDKAEGRLSILQETLIKKQEQLKQISIRLPAIEKAQALIQHKAQETQNQIKSHIEDIVNTGLDTCFPETYNCHVDFISKRGKTECDIYLHDEKSNRVNPLNDNGGGLCDIVSFSLRLACWVLSNTDDVIILDEPFKFLSKNLRPLAGDLLKNLSQELNLQIIMVTHDEEMIEIADTIHQI